MENEVYHGLIGGSIGRFWWAKSFEDDSEGTPGQVKFNPNLIMDREDSQGDIIGFYHTHPQWIGSPSPTDYRTMSGWIVSFGRPLLCLIEGTDGLNANWFIEYDQNHVVGKVWKFGKYYFGFKP